MAAFGIPVTHDIQSGVELRLPPARQILTSRIFWIPCKL